jgi:hypothetical protein
MPRPDQVRGHAVPHLAKSDEANFHGLFLLLIRFEAVLSG